MSTTVSNPYSFNIVNNRNFSSPAIIANLPSSNTFIFSTDKGFWNKKTITIPSMVKVICISGSAYGDYNYDSEDTYSSAKIFIKNSNNNKVWVDCYDSGDMGSSYVECEKYIGVTPGKSYNLDISLGADGYGADVFLSIYYSASINNHSVELTDY